LLESILVQEAIELYRQWLAQAKPLYQATLWNGQYYNLDSESGSEVILADQLCGQFYAQLLKLPDIVPADCAQSALKTVYDTCFLKFCNAQLGAVNALRTNEVLEETDSSHPLAVSTGLNFGLAAFLIKLGMKDEAWQLTEAVVRQVYEQGLQFRTPEAITPVGTFRSSHNLGAMGIWAIYQWIMDNG
ncbi:MAG: bile acid beta-glucosidase, partial [Symploca sp. SIO1A3]|nr:bile acid beta-glucosidase [Symploca sp. SIO1A3]